MKLLYSLILCVFGFFLNAQIGEIPCDSKPGACYAKCMPTNLYQDRQVELAVYTGTEESILANSVKDTLIIIKDSYKEWQKTKSPNCLSANPNDCLVWCLIDIEAEKVLVSNYLADRSVTSDYEISYLNYQELVHEANVSVYQEIVCAKDLTSDLVKVLRDALGLEPTDSRKKRIKRLDFETKKALHNYQQKHGLYLGSLTLETLDHMGIEYYKTRR